MQPGKVVLVVDDDRVNRRILAKILSDRYTVTEAENGWEAMCILKEKRDDIAAVLLDLNMPLMDGFEFLDTVHNSSLYQNIPIIISTGSNGREVEIRALQMGAWDFVTKPYDPTILKLRLRNAIERSQLSAFQS